MDTLIEYKVRCPKKAKMVYVGDACRECPDNKGLRKWGVRCGKLGEKQLKGGE